MQKILKRLELIKNGISLEDEEIVELQVKRLLQMGVDETVTAIIDAIHRREYSSVISSIDEYLGRFNGLVAFEDIEISGLRLELKLLERELEELTDQRNDMQLQLDQFNLHYQLELGELIRDILGIRRAIQTEKILKAQQRFEKQKAVYEQLKEDVAEIKRHKVDLEEKLEQCDEFSDEYDCIYDDLHQVEDKLRESEEQLYQYRQSVRAAKDDLEGSPDYEAYQEAYQDYETFERHNKEIVPDDCFSLTDTEEEQLRSTYKKAARLCHPDLVDHELVEQATLIMQKLNAAKRNQNLSEVLQILHKLESGLVFEVASNTLSDKKQLLARIDQIKITIDQVKEAMNEIMSHESWNTLKEIEDVNVYFNDMKDLLSEEYAYLSIQLEELKRVEPEVDLHDFIEVANKKIDEALDSERCTDSPTPEELDEYFSDFPPEDEDEYWREQF